MSNFFEGQQLDPKFIVEQFMNLFKTLGTVKNQSGGAHEKIDQADVFAIFKQKREEELGRELDEKKDIEEIKAITAERDRYWPTISVNRISIPKSGGVPRDPLDPVSVEKVMKNYNAWKRSVPLSSSSPPPLEDVKERKTEERKREPEIEEPEPSEPALKVDEEVLPFVEGIVKKIVSNAVNHEEIRDAAAARREAAAVAAREAKSANEMQQAMHDSYVTGKTEKLFRTLKDRFNFHKTSKIPAGLVKEFLTAVNDDAEEAAIQAHITDLENVKVREDKAAADGKIKKDLSEEDLRKKAFALLQRSTVLRKKLFKQAQGQLSAIDANKESLEQFKVHPKNKETATTVAKVAKKAKTKKVKKGGEKLKTSAENISILV